MAKTISDLHSHVTQYASVNKLRVRNDKIGIKSYHFKPIIRLGSTS